MSKLSNVLSERPHIVFIDLHTGAYFTVAEITKLTRGMEPCEAEAFCSRFEKADNEPRQDFPVRRERPEK